jgi:hypothetical protein
MAGHRARSGRKLGGEHKIANRRRFYAARIEQASTTAERLRAVVEEFISVLGLLPPHRAGELADLVEERTRQATEDGYSDVLAATKQKEWKE